jgi:acyl-CoA synthetase (AMP-forming)/AMP-acid ligase II
MSIGDIHLKDFSHDRPDTVLAAGGTPLTRPELERLSRNMATALTARGIQAGECVIVFMDNSWEAVISSLAVLKAGAIAIPIPSRAAVSLPEIINERRATGLITQSSLATAAVAAMAETTSLRLTVIAGCQGAPVIDGILRFEDAISEESHAPERPSAAA